jgi:Flp pilus assembly protein TadG
MASRPWTSRAERGSVSSWYISAAFILILGVGIAVDLTGQVHAQQLATSVAGEAARAGAQQLDQDAAVTGAGVAVIDPAAAAQAANGYLAAAGFTGTVRVRGDIVAVRVDTEYRTKFLGFVGLSRFPATGEGEARAVQALNGAER